VKSKPPSNDHQKSTNTVLQQPQNFLVLPVGPIEHEILQSLLSNPCWIGFTAEALGLKPPTLSPSYTSPTIFNMSPHDSSSSTSSTDGAAFPWILEHLLAYPGSYEIPLRTMYTLNSAPSAKQHPRQSTQSVQPGTPSLSSTASSPDSSPASPNFPLEQQHQLAAPSATEHFKSCLMTHISKLPSQPFSLPPNFITSFVRRCFTTELCLVDFTQALTAMDYLKDLENRRKRELTLALQRLDLDQNLVDQSRGEISKNSGISEWVQSMRDKERKVEALYTSVYIGLRRWVWCSGSW